MYGIIRLTLINFKYAIEVLHQFYMISLFKNGMAKCMIYALISNYIFILQNRTIYHEIDDFAKLATKLR